VIRLRRHYEDDFKVPGAPYDAESPMVVRAVERYRPDSPSLEICLARCRLRAEDPEHLGPGSEALRTSVVPLDEDLEVIGIEHVAAQTDPEVRAKKLDSIALGRDTCELGPTWLRSSEARLRMRRRPHASPFLSPDFLLPSWNWVLL
jgi:hypothetical protein